VAVNIVLEVPGAAYADLVSGVPDVLVHASPEWARFVAAVCPAARPIYFVARQGSRPVAALPAFELQGHYGPVINSLPYFGSHGDLIVASDCDRPTVVGTLIGALSAYARDQNVTALNLVASPFRTDDSELVGAEEIRRVDDRIGQISHLPRADKRAEVMDQLLACCSKKTRNLVRKGLKSGFRITRKDDAAELAKFHRHHVLGMSRIGGTAKPIEDLVHLRDVFGSSCHLWIADCDGTFAGGLLTLVYRQWVEYFMPVAVEQHRNRQVLSALIFTAMTEYALQGFHYWNWGGTWRTQEGVYRFKRGWGASDHVYGYYGFARRDVLAGVCRRELLASYPSFYVLPFTSLEETPSVSQQVHGD
jgi:hypothetical protein